MCQGAPGKPEVSHFQDAVVVNQQVGCLQVTMHDPIGVQMVQSFTQLLHVQLDVQ